MRVLCRREPSLRDGLRCRSRWKLFEHLAHAAQEQASRQRRARHRRREDLEVRLVSMHRPPDAGSLKIIGTARAEPTRLGSLRQSLADLFGFSRRSWFT